MPMWPGGLPRGEEYPGGEHTRSETRRNTVDVVFQGAGLGDQHRSDGEADDQPGDDRRGAEDWHTGVIIDSVVCQLLRCIFR